MQHVQARSARCDLTPGRAIVFLLVAASLGQDAGAARAVTPLTWSTRAAAPVSSEPAVSCATDLAAGLGAAEGPLEPLTEGQPLRFDQNPRLLRADHTGGLSFDRFLVVGDVSTVTFDRFDRSAAGFVSRETWERTGTTSIAGRVISVFNPSWDHATVRETVRRFRRGVDKPVVHFGTFIAPGGRSHDIRLNVGLLNMPESTVTRIDDGAQFASHVVNLVIPTFGDGRIANGHTAVDFEDATARFYANFQDAYDSIAFVTRQTQVGVADGFHRNVGNPVSGLGALQVFDDSARYGSGGVLRSVELYPGASFGTHATSHHQIGHQWVDYWDWSALAGSAASLRAEHTPLLTPGAAYTGAALQATRRVAPAVGAPGADASFAVERSGGGVIAHAITRYRMGLVDLAAVPELRVFADQRQLDVTDPARPEASGEPDPGTAVRGGSDAVHINDIIALHGPRGGPVETRWRRATVVVSRGALLSKVEMDYWNFLSARHARISGTTSWTGLPSFFEATGGRVPLETVIHPIADASLADDGPPSVSSLPIDPGEFPGVRLTAAVPAVVPVGQLVTTDGTITAEELRDAVIACARWQRYGSPDPNEVFVCASTTAERFSLPVRFSEAQAGRYTLEIYLFAQSESSEPPLAWVSGIEVR